MYALACFSIAYGTPVLKEKGKTIQLKDLPASVRTDFFEAERARYETQRTLLEEYMLQSFFEKKAKKSKTTAKALRKKAFEVKTPTEKQLKKFYDANKEEIPYPYVLVKDKLPDFYRGKKLTELRSKYLDQAMRSKGYKVLLTEPLPETLKLVTKGYAQKGAQNAKLTIVEFADYQCPHCKAANKVLTEAMSKMGKKIRYVYVDYPINPSGVSRKVAEYAYCVRKHKGDAAYWDFHNHVFANQQRLFLSSASAKLAKEKNVWSKEVDACSSTSEAKAFVANSESYGKSLGVKSTPTVYVNGRRTLLSENPKVALKKLRSLL
jgi:protein-disulfide isomerase